MSLHFVPLTISDIRKETAECVSIAFHIPEEHHELFRYTQGQNITIRANIDGEELRRSYSICTAVYENELRVAVKKTAFGRFSCYANEKLKVGDSLDVMPPTGKFFVPLRPENKKHYLAFAAGSGITPVISIIKTTLQTEPHSDFTLVYGNRSRASIIFFEELEAIKNRYLNRFNLIHILSRERMETPVHFGRIDAAKCSALDGRLVYFEQMDDIFLCGPENLIFSVRDWLLARGIDRRKIHFELFTTPDQPKPARSGSEDARSSEAKVKLTIKQDGRSMDMEIPFHGDSILDAALKQGADLPFACKGGVCSTCRARLLEGEVEMDANWALEPEELEQGFILTCQAHPKTERVVVDYDN